MRLWTALALSCLASTVVAVHCAREQPAPPHPTRDLVFTRVAHVQAPVSNRTAHGHIELVLGDDRFDSLMFDSCSPLVNPFDVPNARVRVETSLAPPGQRGAWTICFDETAMSVHGKWHQVTPREQFNRVRLSLHGSPGDLFLGDVLLFKRRD